MTKIFCQSPLLGVSPLYPLASAAGRRDGDGSVPPVGQAVKRAVPEPLERLFDDYFIASGRTECRALRNAFLAISTAKEDIEEDQAAHIINNVLDNAVTSLGQAVNDQWSKLSLADLPWLSSALWMVGELSYRHAQSETRTIKAYQVAADYLQRLDELGIEDHGPLIFQQEQSLFDWVTRSSHHVSHSHIKDSVKESLGAMMTRVGMAMLAKKLKEDGMALPSLDRALTVYLGIDSTLIENTYEGISSAHLERVRYWLSPPLGHINFILSAYFDSRWFKVDEIFRMLKNEGVDDPYVDQLHHTMRRYYAPLAKEKAIESILQAASTRLMVPQRTKPSIADFLLLARKLLS